MKKLAQFVSLDTVIHVISTIIGIAPVFDRRTRDGRKFSKIGLIFSIIDMSILFYLYNTLERLEDASRHFMTLIPYGMLVIKRNVDLWLPLLFIIGSIFQFSAFDKFLCKLDIFDTYLMKNHADMKYIEISHRNVQILMLFYVLFGTIISILSTCWYRSLFEAIVPGLVYKYGIFYAHVFLVTFKFFTNLYGIGLRIDSFKWVLGDIRFRKFNRLDVLPRYQLKIRL